jgi:hypothetical protein
MRSGRVRMQVVGRGDVGDFANKLKSGCLLLAYLCLQCRDDYRPGSFLLCNCESTYFNHICKSTGSL